MIPIKKNVEDTNWKFKNFNWIFESNKTYRGKIIYWKYPENKPKYTVEKLMQTAQGFRYG